MNGGLVHVSGRPHGECCDRHDQYDDTSSSIRLAIVGRLVRLGFAVAAAHFRTLTSAWPSTVAPRASLSDRVIAAKAPPLCQAHAQGAKRVPTIAVLLIGASYRSSALVGERGDHAFNLRV